MERLPSNVTIIYLSNPSLSREDILYAIADELNLDVQLDSRAAVVLKTLQSHLIEAHALGKQVVVLIDEAHAMPAETLEEIRLLSNLESNRHKLLQLVLFGQPELNGILARPDMRQLKERITHNFSLEPLVLSDVGSYLEFRLRAAGYKGPFPFTSHAVQLISKTSLGLTRRINILADKCLLAAFANNIHQIGVAEANIAIRDCDFSDATDRALNKSMTPIAKWSMVSFTVLVLVGVVAATALHRWPSDATNQIPSATSKLAARADIDGASQAPNASSSLPPELSGSETPPSIAKLNTLPPPETTVTRVTAVPDRTGPLTRRFIKDGDLWLAKADDNRWFLQLTASDGRNPEAIETFLRNLAKSDISIEQVRAYYASTDNIQRFGVIYGDFESRAAALAELTSLPQSVRASRPFVRQVAQLR
jgi:type II secretory pathway predicted ATPase ExeA/septal ring-binding cell division protein DamX